MTRLGDDLACPNPVFVIGSPRSGTSVVPWALAQHPRFWTSPESAFLQEIFSPGVVTRCVAAAETAGWTSALGIDRTAFASHLGLGINVLLTERSGGRRWIDQTPSNTNIVEELAQLFPDACFLHVVRDGRRVVHSMQHFRRTLGARLAAEGRLPMWAGDFQSSTRTWTTFVGMALAFEHEHPQRCFRLRLEDAVRDPEEVFSHLIERLGEAPDPGPAEFFRSRRINSSFGDESGDADPIKVAEAGDPSSSWTADERQVFFDAGGDALLDVLGYLPSSTQAGTGSGT